MADEERDTSPEVGVAAASTTQSLVRGLSVIRIFGAGRSALKVSEVATQANVTRATARRILLTLQELGYVTEHESRFSLSPKVLDLGYAYLSSLELSDLIEPAMARLAASVDHPCSAAVLDGDDIVIVQILQGPTSRLLRFNAHIGTRLQAYPGAMGRVLLGGLPAADLAAYLARVQLEALTPFTVRSKKALKAAIVDARERGWCLVDRERDLGVVSLAVPLVGRSGRLIAALNVSIHAGSLTAGEAVRKLLPPLQKAQNQINDALRVRE